MEIESSACDIKGSSSSQTECNNYSKCRCCLAFGKHRHNFGQAELEMLMENLNLFLMADPRLPQLLCSECVTSLNEVQRFRRKVMASEEELRRAVCDEIKCENSEQLSQSDPLEINDVKSEQDSSINSVAVDKAVTKVCTVVKIEIEPREATSSDIKSKTVLKYEKVLKLQNKSNVKQKEPKLLRRLRVAPINTKGFHLVPKDSKGLCLVPLNNKDLQKSSKGLELVPVNIKDLPHTSKGLRLVSINSKDLTQSSKGLRLVPTNSKDLHVVPQTSDALPLSGEPNKVKNENDIPLNDKRKRRINDSETQTASKKKKHDYECDQEKCDSESDVHKYDSDSDKNNCDFKSDFKKCGSASDIKEKSGSESDAPISHTQEELDVRAAMLSKLETARHLLLKDNNKVRSNIHLILENSTIMPFKNNSQFTFKCFYCDKLYVPFKELKQHIAKEHRDMSSNNAHIRKIVKSMQNLIVTADISCIQCTLCNEKCNSIEYLIEHLCIVHGKVYHETDRKPSHGILGVDLSSDTLKCHICKQDHTFFKNLLVHMNEHYGVFVCYVCGKKFLSERRYKSHVTNAHADNEIKCKECSKVFKTEPSLKSHIMRVHLKKRVKCLYCSETFTSGNYMKRLNHMAEAHGVAKPVFKCDICGKELANSGSVAHHKMYTHKQGKMNRCELCGYMTCSNTAMKNHMIVHSGEKNHECQFCKKKFAALGTLKLHLKIHTNDKRFVCVLCDAAFIQKNSLKNHLKSRHPDAGVDISKL